ncbi:DUF2203 domain-containing protein [Marinitenerispora sediminis]|uniref:DUF2203 domain-containing protein n=2 Tax=Marinitenerispora sediminis TaxID=1931232 RepID=A0A368T9X7_9ACTN|nr:DUF2203 domain-containing protein [Marinitenerispora sediminis]RCV56215.1 DUF2203 domain-containing protein [Marinitenerispora sediminis]RCV59446.1 DUF2203 domain-containing protein [Marinitenerispora sediminis]
MSAGSAGPARGSRRPRVFTVAEARALMPQVRAHADEIVTVRADMAELAADLRIADDSPLGGLPELKALEARLAELGSWFASVGVELKGFAPVLVDFPAELNGVSVRLCWVEGEQRLAWYHRSDLGFVARRPLPPTEREP